MYCYERPQAYQAVICPTKYGLTGCVPSYCSVNQVVPYGGPVYDRYLIYSRPAEPTVHMLTKAELFVSMNVTRIAGTYDREGGGGCFFFYFLSLFFFFIGQLINLSVV